MKKIIITILAMFVFIPSTVFASTQARDFLETFEEASITPKVKDYKENEDQVVIYMFWWTSCDHCHEALSFFNDILEDYKDKIKMRSYETGANSDNFAIQKKIANWFEVKTGVPLIVIGENTFYGYNGDETAEKIKIAIDDVYSTPVKERYDVFEEMKKGKPETKKKNTTLILLIPAILVIVVICIFIKNKNK